MRQGEFFLFFFLGDHCQWNSFARLGCNLNPRSCKRGRNWGGKTLGKKEENKKEGEGRNERQRESNVSWVQKVNRGTDCSMLSAGQEQQLGQTHGSIRTIRLTNTFMSRREGWLLSVSLIFISLPLGTAWPYGKSCAMIYLHCTCLSPSSNLRVCLFSLPQHLCSCLSLSSFVSSSTL